MTSSEEKATQAPSETALSAKAFMERIDNRTYRQVLETRAVLGGWVGAREAGLWDTRVSDAVAKAALNAVLELIRGWAAERDPASAPGTGAPGEPRRPSS